MKILDIETDGFLAEVTQIYCAWVYDTDTAEFTCYNNQNNGQGTIEDFLAYASTGDLLAHYGIGFDYLVIEKLYPEWKPAGTLYDSVLLSQLIWPDLKSLDFARRAKPSFADFPGKLIGSHSLQAWGWRLGNYKSDFSPSDFIDEETGEVHTWATVGWRQEMEDYCKQDVQVTLELWNSIQRKHYSQKAIDLETAFAPIIKRQELFGWAFDGAAADQLLAKLLIHKAKLTDDLAAYFPPWVVETPFVPKANNKTRGYVKGELIIKRKTVTFNPGSRDHIADRLTTLYGWKPSVFNEKDGKPTVDEQTLKDLDYPPVPALIECLMVDKRLGQLSSGRQAWLKSIKEGRIHGRVNTLGAITGRCTHSNPNVAQVPSSGSPYGAECRALFGVPHGYTLVGTDAAGLELRCLAHYMAAHDGGAYGDVILHGDIHTENQNAAGLPTRDNAKTFIYGFL